MSEKLKRPQQVTLAAIVAGTAGVVMLISIGDRLSRWNSLDVREQFTEALARDDVGRRLGLSVDQALDLARIAMFVAAGLAAAIVVLAVFAARRDRGARLGLTIVAGPLLLLGLLVDPFLVGFIVVGAVLLWSEPARDWYAGRAPREPQRPAGSHGASRSVDVPSGQDRGGQVPGGQVPAAQAPPPRVDAVLAPPPGGPAAYTGGYGVPRGAPSGPGARPSQVVVACVTTWLLAGLVAVFSLVSLVGTVVPGARDQVRAEVTRAIAASSQRSALEAAGITVDQLVTIAQVMLVVVLVWALLAVVLGVLAFHGQGWARVTLIVSSCFAGLLGVLGALGAVPLLLVTLGCVVTVSRLLSVPAAHWYAERARRTAATER